MEYKYWLWQYTYLMYAELLLGAFYLVAFYHVLRQRNFSFRSHSFLYPRLVFVAIGRWNSVYHEINRKWTYRWVSHVHPRTLWHNFNWICQPKESWALLPNKQILAFQPVQSMATQRLVKSQKELILYCVHCKALEVNIPQISYCSRIALLSPTIHFYITVICLHTTL